MKNIALLRISFVFAILSLLTACGTTSNMKQAKGAPSSLSDYSVVYVADFTNKTDSKIRDAGKLEIYQQMVNAAGIEFANMIGTNIEKTKSAPAVLRAAPTGSDAKVLRVEGEITLFKRGNAFAKMMLPFAGSTKFNANVRFVDHLTGELVGEILVDKNSSPLGGGIAATQTTNSFMKGAADKIAEQLEIARNPKQ
jgi:predicted outer membrane repeat protein